LRCVTKDDAQRAEQQRVRENNRLRKASGAGNIERMQALIERGAVVDTTDLSRLGETPLHKAAKYGRVEATRVLLSTPMNSGPARATHAKLLNAKNIRGQTPLHLAASRRQLGSVEALLQEPATELNARDGRGRHPVSTALEAQSLPCASAIVAHSCFDIRDENLLGIWRTLIRESPSLLFIRHSSRLSGAVVAKAAEELKDTLSDFAAQLACKSSGAVLRQVLEQLKGGPGYTADARSVLTLVVADELANRMG
jgi:ankyrin repeat protein